MKRYKVIVTARSFGKTDDQAKDILEKNGCKIVKIEAANGSVEEQIRKEIVDSDAVIAGLDDYTGEIIKSGKKLKVISRYGVGYDKVDLETAKKNNVAVTITPGANGDSVADMAVALMLDVARNVAYMDRTMKEKNQQRPDGVEMWQKTIGVIGAGRIGQGVARRCKGFDMRVLCYDMYENELFKKEVGAEYVDLNTLLKKSDFITIHSPLTPETENMIDKKAFAVMKNEAIIINTARGGIINEKDLYQALKGGAIRGAGLDATVKEPPYDSELLTLDNCIITPHAGAATKEASNKMSVLAAQNVVDILTRGVCDYQV
ncbi:phosphoglycerate dehydrogenase [Faecalicatena contorta]|uniref:D-3-phosphoglycerate dehydrogenase n=1 Tax=Faecalicatena contorta TaxID=39482 RepID=A0A315ZX06_9FIRM|nr:phosphoglycerate dehydrogenase [Faecalicatena contorta]PWJ49829.1 D-3-phosphoglycerate dehydrogenase [Faecalicatena contorta]SUQ14547.1 D-3-phosphoglycerate dehydrogenase [Faecalicatena contorta]